MLSTDQLASNRPYGTVADPLRAGAVGSNSVPLKDADDLDQEKRVQTLSSLLVSGSVRPAIADVLRWADQLLEQLHRKHVLSPPVIHGRIAPANIRLDAGSDIELMPGTGPAGGQDVSYRPLEQIWEGLNDVSRRVILDRSDEDTEKWLLEPLNAASDIYSVGATLYAVSTGVIPNDALDRSIAAIEDKPDPLRAPAEIDPAIPQEISDVILKAMSLRKSDRFYSAVILRQILRTAAVKVKERHAENVPQRRRADLPEALPPVASTSATDQDKERARELARRILAEKAPPPPDVSRPNAAVHSVEENVLEIPVVTSRSVETPREIPAQTEAGKVEISSDAKVIRERSSSRLFVIGVAALVLISGIGVGIYKFAVPESRVAEPTASTSPVIQQPVAEPQPRTEVVSLPVAPPASETSAASATSAERPTRASVAAQPEKQKKPQAQPGKPTPKKALTVDDLINDH